MLYKNNVSCTVSIFTETPRILVAGGKGVGKSSFLRHYVNRLRAVLKAQSVLYLDLDPGQAE